MKIKWQIFKIGTEEIIKSGEYFLGRNSTRTIGPGINNHTISILKKGEQVTVISEALGIKAVYTPVSVSVSKQF